MDYIRFKYFFDFKGNDLIKNHIYYDICYFDNTDDLHNLNKPTYLITQDRVIIELFYKTNISKRLILHSLPPPATKDEIQQYLYLKNKTHKYFIELFKLYQDGLTVSKDIYRKAYKDHILRKYLYIPKIEI